MNNILVYIVQSNKERYKSGMYPYKLIENIISMNVYIYIKGIPIQSCIDVHSITVHKYILRATYLS